MRTVTLIIFIFIISCKDDNLKHNIVSEKNEIEEIEIVLPELPLWTELYSNKLVKNRFDVYNNDGNKIIGVYLNKEIAKRVDSLEYLEFDDYSLFFKVNSEQKWKIKNSDLKKICNSQIEQLGVKTLDIEEVINKAYSDTTYVKAEKTYELKVFQKTNNIYSSIQLIKPNKGDNSYVIIYVYNLINIKNHLIYGGYYLDFNGNESIERAMYNNEIIMSEFFKVNKSISL